MDGSILYVSDLDGTLLNTRDRISPYSLNVINTLIEKGMKFTYATARSLVSASRVAEGLTLHIPVIVYNGAFIMEADTGKILYSAKMAEKESRFLEEYFNRAGLSPLVYTFREGQEKVRWYPSRENYGIKRYLSMRKDDSDGACGGQGEPLSGGNVLFYLYRRKGRIRRSLWGTEKGRPFPGDITAGALQARILAGSNAGQGVQGRGHRGT